MFPITFQTSAVAVAQIFAMGALGFYLVKGGVIQEPGLRLLSFLSVNVFFPLFIFYQIITNFDVQRLPFWWAFPLVNISLVAAGLVVASLVARRHRQSPLKDAFIAVSCLHNAGYIPLLMMMSLPLTSAWGGQVYACVILSIIGFDSCLWSLGMWLLTRGSSSRMDLSKMLNPPLLSMAAAILLTLLFGHGFIPEMALRPVKILGDVALGLATIVIGGNLSLTLLTRELWMQVTAAALIKLVVLPVMTLLVLSVLKLNPLISLVAMIQACMPSSITLSIIGRSYETKNQDLVNQTIFVTHLLCMVTIPIFLGFYGKLRY